jgi:hypothetical protein
MNSASSTTITVNTSLFAAGDTVFIVNQGAGVCTVTAGTATVSTASSLALSQYETGQLYFLSTSAAVFTEYTQAAAASGGMTSIASGSLSGALSLTSISGAYKDLVLVLRAVTVSNDDINLRLNADTGSNYAWLNIATALTSVNRSSSSTGLQLTQPYIQTGNTPNEAYITIQDYTNTTSHKTVISSVSGNPNGTKTACWNTGVYASTSAITGISTVNSFSGGTYILYGVN